MKRLLVFGSTGSIGENTLAVARENKNEFKVIGLSAKRDINRLYRQIKEFRPKYVCVSDEAQAKKIKARLPKTTKLFSGSSGLREFAGLSSDISLMAISGISCLEPLLENIKYTKRIALANKESLVTAGSLVFKEARRYNSEILPVDSEINALFQIFGRFPGAAQKNVSKVYLTASGGALNGCSKKDLARVNLKKVLAHPTWSMGKRITIDCATLVNKGFEVVETHFFFGLPYEKIDIVLHPESMVHALIQEADGTLFACLYPPDMKLPITFALYHPKRNCAKSKLGLKKGISCNFKPLSCGDYPLLKIILEAAKRQDNSLAVLNACDEVMVDYFIRGKIKFTDIHKVMQYIFKKYPASSIRNIKDVFYWDNWARVATKERINKL